jgi:uncharacterized protein YbjT (DUF2867 family)
VEEFQRQVLIRSLQPDDDPAAEEPGPEPFHADIEDESSVAAAVAGMRGVVKAVSLYLEHGSHTFRSVHVKAAANLAAQGRGVQGLSISSTFPEYRQCRRILLIFAAAVKAGRRQHGAATTGAGLPAS